MKLTIPQLQQLIPGAELDRRQKNLYGTCPKCGENEFGISLEDNHRFGCFRKVACGFSGNIFTLCNYLGVDIRTINPSFAPKAHIDIDKILNKSKVEINLDLPRCTLPIGYKRIYHNDYLESRGFTEEDYQLIPVGETKLDPKLIGFLVFPIEQYGEIKATVSRSKKAKGEIEMINAYNKQKGIANREKRYLNSSSDFAKILLGLNEITESTHTVILEEGLFDKQNTDKKLLLREQEEIKCCATFKCGASPEQTYLLRQTNVKNIILLYDPDVIGEIKETAHNLNSYFNVQVGFNKTGEDPGDMENDMFDMVFSNLMSPDEFSSRFVEVPKLRKK